MDFMWFWVSVAISVEVVRQSYQQCYPKKKPSTAVDSLTEPLLRADGSCPYSCCVKTIDIYETDAGAETDTDTAESSDEFVSDEVVSDGILSSEELEEEYTKSLIHNREFTNLVKDDYIQEITGRIYPAGPGRPKTVYFKVSKNGGAPSLTRESSLKIHPQPNGEAAVDSSVGAASSKDNRSYDSRVLAPIQEVMVANHGKIPGGGNG